MSLLKRLKGFLTGLNDEYQDAKVEVLGEDHPLVVQPRGHVVKTKHADYDPNNHRHGGRVVKGMPKNLRKIKEAQEKVEDDS